MSPAALARGLAERLEALGPLGLFLAAALDAFVPLPHVVEPMVILLSYRSGNPVLYSGLAVAGSVVGTTLLFLIVRLGGEAYARRGMSERWRAPAERTLQRFGALTVVVGGVLPPPFPFKAVVLLAGLGRMPLASFVAGLTVARTFRYGLEAVLAVRYGDRVIDFMKVHYPAVGGGLALLLVGGWLCWRRLRPLEAAPVE